MSFEFLYEHFSDYKIEKCKMFEAEGLCIINPNFEKPIQIFYELDDYNCYTVFFATQHVHITDKTKLLETVSKYADGSLAAIEFYNNGKNSFGGHIKTETLAEISYEGLRNHFGYLYYDISHLTFRVYAWNKDFCYEGSFVKQADGVKIIKKY